MANTFKNYRASSVGKTGEAVYTVGANTTSVMIGCNLANVGTGQIKVDVLVAGTNVVKDVVIPTGASLSALDGKIIVEAGQSVVVKTDTEGSCDVILSVLEQT